MLEGKFKTDLIADIRILLPGCIVIHNDARYLTGVPDLTILFGRAWGCLEGKKSDHEVHQPGQDWFVATMDEMSFASFVYPENRKEVLDALSQSLRARR